MIITILCLVGGAITTVKRWIDDNDFKQNEDALRSESFQSLATSQMFAYIHKHDKTNSKQLSMELLDDYIDDIATNGEPFRINLQ